MSAAARRRVAVVGAGRLGTALACGLAAAGRPLAGLAARRLASARRAAEAAGAGRPTTSLGRAVEGAGTVLLCVPDDSLPGVVRRLAVLPGWAGRIVLHAAGALGPDVLDPLSRAGAAVGVLHPLRSFPSRRHPPRRLRGVRAAIEGDPEALREARGLCRDLGLVPLALAPGGSTAYHAAAVLASNHLVALAAAAVELLGTAGVEDDDALAALLPLMGSTMRGLGEEGLAGALTGPVARGDAATVARHLEALEARDAELASLYRLLSRRALRLARRAGALESARARRLETLLGGPRRRR